MDVLKRFVVLFWVYIASIPLIGCQATYLVKNSYHQMGLLMDRQPIEKVLKDPKVSEETKAKLRVAQDAISFAENDLKMDSNGNYKTYVQLQKPYVTWVVRVSPIYKLEPYLWSFPIVGSVPYKGFFNEEGAKEEIKNFPGDKWDTSVRGVTAYSTLGWFRDPILSSMTRYEDRDLVNVIIHETVHANLYIKGEADFNERLATFLGNLGTELYYIKKEGPDSPTVKTIKNENIDDKLFSDWISKEIENLKKWYKDNEGKVTPELKQARFNEIKTSFEKNLKPRLQSKGFDNFAKQELNNASLLNYQTYYYDLSDFERLFEKLGHDFPALLQFCKNLAKSEHPESDLKRFITK